MSCSTCTSLNDAVDPELPHVVRVCPDCGDSYRARETANHGYGLNIEEGDQVVLPSSFLTLTANPLKGRGQFSRAGIAWLAELVFGVEFASAAARQSLPEKLAELQKSNENFFEGAEALSGLDLDDPANEDEVLKRLQANPKSVEWWGYLAAGLTHMAAEALKAGDASTAVWAAISAERFRTLAVFKGHFEEAVHIGNSAGRLVELLRIWAAHRENSSEGFWQETFKHHAYAFGQLFSAPVTFIEGSAYVGGMQIDRKDARYVDFMLAAGQGSHAILVEIKTPKTPLLGTRYRGNAYPPSKDLGGAVVQISDYSKVLSDSAAAIGKTVGRSMDAFSPRRVIVIGNYDEQLGDAKKRASFELFRRSLSGIDVITFDELFKKVEELAKLFNITQSPRQHA